MTRDFIDNIERTPVYNAFMQQLERHHQRLGTPLQKEPVLGSRKLDMFKIYRLVIEAGGCEKVSQERGWRRIAQSFDLPRTCTNAAYVFKAIYYKYLQTFEDVHFWKRIPTATVRQVPAQRPNIYTDPVPMVPRPAPLPETLTTRQLYGSGPQSRLLLALKSHLPNEIDWAFNTLIRLSHQSHEPFDISLIPELLDIMLQLVPPLHFVEHASNTQGTTHHAATPIGQPRRAEDTERILQVLHILRNLSFLGANKSVLAFNARCKELLRAGIALPATDTNVEIRQYCLDTVENISTRMVLRSPRDSLYALLQAELFGADRQGILTAVRALTRLAMNEQNLRALSNINKRLLHRIWEMTLVPDEELVAAVLDYLYQYTGVFEELATQLPRIVDGDVVRRLVQLLVWSSPAEQRAALMQKQQQQQQESEAVEVVPPEQPIATPTATPAEGSPASSQEPARAIAWVRQTFVVDPTAAVGLTSMFLEYQATFRSAGNTLSTVDFVNALKSMQLPVSIVIMSIDGTDIYPFLYTSGFRKAVPADQTDDAAKADTPPAETSLCRWIGCEDTVTDAEKLAEHVHKEHADTLQDATLTCRWMTCTRVFDAPNAQRKLASHLAVHLAPARPGGAKPAESGASDVARPPMSVGPIAEPELIGVPLTASLILRNLARYPDNHPLFQSWEGRLVELMMDPTLSRHIGSVFNQLHAPQADDPLMTVSMAF
ncbi:hypothetical protein THASP1DRAFT_33231 [Thamnocephalis sphaerospora]|uniref:ARID domain-containing protein n=1 Tax=Thamnocephalis sphaerospora TaxID=78915 RepID=A0A4P9XH26_9FUNG|nr:hypothetical protein THASP1DRAFT_33231 [Thamnocephalis sphaerospora]|eukprot:RKP04947.1 hypothetical protein THASP1DRAFT_33231 [Thamnocephalis sphaerospora]